MTLALRTQQVIAHETGVTNTVDPLGGSYFVEALTDEMERSAYEYFAKIDELGGMVEAVKRNYPQREIAEAAFELQREIDAGERIVVGVNRFVPRTRSRSPRCASIRARAASSNDSRRSRATATQSVSRQACGSCAKPPPARPTCCPLSVRRCASGLPSARSAPRCATSSAATA